MRTALLIAGKDLRQRARDRSALLVAFVVPLALASIFGLVFHDVANGGVTCSCNFGLVNQDRGEAARAFVTQALRPLERQGLVHVRIEPSAAAARAAADGGSLGAAFVLEPGFTAAVHSGKPARLLVIGNVDEPISVQVASAIAGSFASRADTVDVARVLVGPNAAAAAATASPPIRIADVSARSNQLSVGTFYAAGMAVFFLFFTVQFGISTIVDERRDGTLARMLAAPVRRGSVLAGKLLTSLVLGVVSMSVLALATHFLLNAHWGNPLGVALLIVAGVLAATAIMSLVVAVARTSDQAQAWQSMIALVLGMLGGTFFPVAQAGGVLALASRATPQAWFLQGIQNLAGGHGAGVVVGPAAAMLAFAAVAGAAALVLTRRMAAR